MQAGAVFTYLAPFVAVTTLVVAALVYARLAKYAPGNELMQKIAGFIRTGAMAYLKTQYRILMVFVVLVALLLFFFVNRATSLAFVAGALLSMLAGYAGMKAATTGNVRTANAARKGLSDALAAAFDSGSIMGFAVAGFGLLGVSAFFLAFHDVESVRARSFRAFSASRYRSRALPASAWEQAASPSSPGWGEASSRKAPMSVPIWWERSRPEFPRTIPGIPPS